VESARAFCLKSPTGDLFMTEEVFFEFINSVYELNRIIPPSSDMIKILFSKILGDVTCHRASFESICSTIILSSSSRLDEKIWNIFQVVDSNNDGKISLNELVTLLTLIFQHVFNRNVVGAMLYNGVNVSRPEDLARRMGIECFNSIIGDLSSDEISVNELVAWFKNPKNSPVL
jgi:hypothetical protein